MLAVSSIRIAVMMVTMVSIVFAGQYEVDSFNDRTDGQFRRHSKLGRYRFVLQGATRACPPINWALPDLITNRPSLEDGLQALADMAYMNIRSTSSSVTSSARRS